LIAPDRPVPRLSMTIMSWRLRSGPSMNRYDPAESIEP
jgi:hypothetical protein